MITVELTPEELHLTIEALSIYVTTFGHDEATILSDAQHLLKKLQDVRTQLPTASA